MENELLQLTGNQVNITEQHFKGISPLTQQFLFSENILTACSHVCANAVCAVIIIRANTWKQLQYSLVGGWLYKIWFKVIRPL